MPNTSHDSEGHRAPAWLRWVARSGMVAEGVIYLLIGGLALAGAFDPSQHPSGSNGAMSKLAHVPLGRVLLALLALGLAAFVLWQVIQAVLDPECRKGKWTIKQVAIRIHHLWTAALHCGLVGLAAWQLLGFGHATNNGQTQKHLTAMALHLSGGRWLVGGIAIGILIFGLIQLIMACIPERDTRMDLSQTRWRLPILALLVLGYAARGALFGLIGIFLLHAAWNYDPRQATGVAGALQSLRHHPYGAWLLGAMAVGLIAFGLARIAKTRFREIRTN